MTRTLKALALLVAIAVAAGTACTVKKQDAPPLSGPSELATSITLYASPDTLRQDGASQSQITILAQDSKGQPIRSLPVRLDIAVGGTLADFGQLSGKNLVTGGDGRATALYTSPLPPADSVDSQTVVQILATPGGSDFASATARSVSIRLVPPGIILPPNGTPVAAFVFSPSSPLSKSDVTFDASSSSDSDGRIVSYAWNFGDGSQGSGVLVKHAYAVDGSYTATLTVTDDRGQSASLSKSVSVFSTSSPKADFVASPTAPSVDQKVFFNAAPSTAAAGRTIVRYDWDYGSGRQDSGILVWQIYSQPGSYGVTLTVTDDAGNKGTTSKTVTVSAAGLAARFTFSPSAPTTAQAVYFNGTESSGQSPITGYAWDFGDGSTGTGATPSHAYAAAGTYVVRLTVTDSSGRTATITNPVTVTVTAGGLVALFTFSPTAPTTAQAVYFNGTGSSSQSPITGYAWDFGDGSTGTGATPSHAYAAAGAYVVRLTVTDSSGRTATITNPVTVSTASGSAPTAAFVVSPSPGAVNVPITVDASTSIGQIVTYEWNFGDSAQIYSTTSRTFTHVYGLAGAYTITLRVTDSSGRFHSVSGGISIAGVSAPTANFTFAPSPGTVNVDVTFDGTSSSADVIRWEWTFGDGPPVYTGSTITHKYAAAGTYSVTLMVTNASGRQASISRAVIVQNP